MATPISLPNQEYLTNHRDRPVEELIRATGLTKRVIQNFLKKLPPKEEPKAAAPEPAPPRPPSPGKVALGTMNSSATPGVTVMTPAASQYMDDMKQGWQRQGKNFDHAVVRFGKGKKN